MAGIECTVGKSSNPDVDAAANEALERAKAGLEGTPDFAFVTCTVQHDAARVFAVVREALPNAALHGLTTSLGVLGSDGVTSATDGVVGVLLARGRDVFASAGAEIGDDPRRTARAVAEKIASKASGRRPQVLLFNASPGREEALLAAIAEVFPGVPAYGGSAADNAIEGAWKVMTPEGVFTDGLALTAIFDGVKAGGAFMAPYEITDDEATVTAAAGRRIAKLGDRKASEVLREWVGPSIDLQVRSGGNVLAQTALTPLGIRQPGEGFIAVHPAHLHADGGVDVFADTPEGTVVCRLKSSEEALITALPKLWNRAVQDAGLAAGEVKAAFLIYCAGCAGAVGDRLHDGLRDQLGAAAKGVPILGVCTFGEQGYVEGAGNVHSNLSLALVVLG